jgi:hypothetical protein
MQAHELGQKRLMTPLMSVATKRLATFSSRGM